MTSLTESFNALEHTPLYKNEQNEREIVQWRLLNHPWMQQKPFDKLEIWDGKQYGEGGGLLNGHFMSWCGAWRVASKKNWEKTF